MSMEARKLSIGDKLRILRNEHGITQSIVADDLFTCIASVSRAERDDGYITVHRLKEFCDYYGVTLKDFFDDTYWQEERYK